MNYSEKLKNPKWQRRRLEVFQRDNFTCTFCKDRESLLHVHHLEYFGEPWEVDLQFLQTVCEHCHYVVEYFKKHEISVKHIFKMNNVETSEVFIVMIDTTSEIFFINMDDKDFKVGARMDEGILDSITDFCKSNLNG